MSLLLSLNSLTHRIGNRELFNNINLSFYKNDRFGIIGPNGSGKSSLLKIIAAEISPDKGKVIFHNSPRVAYVSQSDIYEPNLNIEETFIKLLKQDKNLHEDPATLLRYLNMAEFEDFSVKVASLSGGWKKRLSLAIALARNPDILLLDEPTNHLDYLGLKWLEKTINSLQACIITVSHDRKFLDRTATKTLEISPVFPDGYFTSNGNYSFNEQERQKYFQELEKKSQSLANKLRTENEWLSRMPKARTTKASFRIKEAHKLQAEFKSIKRDTISENKGNIAFSEETKDSSQMIKFINAGFSYPVSNKIASETKDATGETIGDSKQIFSNLEFSFGSGHCVGIMGLNGQGKTTLLRLISGELEVTNGKVKRLDGLRISYFDQLRAELNSATTVRDVLSNGADFVQYQGKNIHVIGWAKRFNFESEDLDRKIETLSGGQKARLLLSGLVRQDADVLILDEPTNDLDIPMLETLEEMLIDFKGLSILVTHDRFMLDKVCTHYLGFNNGTVDFYGDYDQWEIVISSQQDKTNNSIKDKNKIELDNSKINSSEIESKKILSKQDRIELRKLEDSIAKLEKKLTNLNAEAAKESVYLNPQEALKYANEIAKFQSELDAQYARWEELEG